MSLVRLDLGGTPTRAEGFGTFVLLEDDQLRLHGIVNDRRDGNEVYYTLITPCVISFSACATQVLKERG